ncbi:sigma factor-like helix-turn-helix DNA-binding protein [Marinicrinis sediminis]|uniref:Sigma factor-like helix-turn-helix DNA-binding protein n=1 Tax=Marinicrinis sediminis TaxID=1652465 RepID=A0ABW5R8T4_9BACL
MMNKDPFYGARTYAVQYQLDHTKGVRKLLSDRYLIAERRYKGDTDASDILIDLSRAIDMASLSDKQAEAVALVYGYWQLTQQEAGQVMQVSQKQVSTYLTGAIRAITAVFKEWEYGQIIVELAWEEEADYVAESGSNPYSIHS